MKIHELESNDFKIVGGVRKFYGVSRLRIRIFDITRDMWFYVVKDHHIDYDLLLGLNVILAFRLCQDHQLNITQASANAASPVIGHPPLQVSSTTCSLANVHNAAVRFWPEHMPRDKFLSQTQHLDRSQRERLDELLSRFLSSFATDRYDIGSYSEQSARIKLSENKVIARKPYKCSFADQEEISRQITQLLKAGLIHESTSPYAAPVTMAFRKSEGEKNRICIDFRGLNKLIIPESFPFPSIDDIILKTKGCTWFSGLDINSAFWTIPIHEKDRYKTGFSTINGHFEWKCLPFGIKTASSIYQRIMSGVIRKHGLSSFCVNYIDDILIFSSSFDDHLRHLQQVFAAIAHEGFKFKFNKCSFATRVVKYLGHLLSSDGIQPLMDNVKSIADFPIPSSKRNVRQLLGKANFYRKFIPNSSSVLEPLHNLLRKDVPFSWTPNCQTAFDTIIRTLSSSPVLALFDHTRPIRIYTDASNEGIGAILKQPLDDGTEVPVAYFSKRLTPSQVKKKAVFLECLAVKECVRFWQYWLLGNHFSIITDHKPLENLRVMVRTDEELGDMIHFLSQFDFDITYRPGILNVEADCLSRNPVFPADCSTNPPILPTVNYFPLNLIHSDQSSLSPDAKVVVHNGIKHRIVRGRKKIWLSPELARRVIEFAHLEYGHIGVSAMRDVITPFFYAKDLAKLIDSFVRDCDICIRNKSRRKLNLGFLGHFGPASKPFEIVSLDTIGGFDSGFSSVRYMHLLVDHFTRFAFISTSKSQSSSDFIHLISSVLKSFKIGTLLTDQFGGLTSQEFADFLDHHSITHIFTATDAAFSQGLNERLNQTLVNRIRCVFNSPNENRSWSTIAFSCVDQYNSTPHSVTRFSPKYLLYGVASSILPPEHLPPSDLESDRKLAFQNSLKNHMYNKKRYDKNRTRASFAISDLVFVENGNKLNREKLHELRIGPFPIVEKVSDSVYRVKCGPSKKNIRLFHISKLIPYSQCIT